MEGSIWTMAKMSEDRSKKSLLSIVNPKRRSISRELTVGLIVTIAVISAITMSLSYFSASRRAKVELEQANVFRKWTVLNPYSWLA